MKTKAAIWLLVTILVVIAILFATGSYLLTQNIFGIPSGNIMVWIGLISLQLLCYFANKGFKNSASMWTRPIRFIMISLIIASVFWFGIAYFLSGNVNFNFNSNATGFSGSPQASIVYWNTIYILILAPVILSLVYTILRFWEKRAALKK